MTHGVMVAERVGGGVLAVLGEARARHGSDRNPTRGTWLAGNALAGNVLAGVEEVRAYLGLAEGEGDDGLIMDCIVEASGWIERVTGRCFGVRERAEFVKVEAGQSRVELGFMPRVGGVVVHGGRMPGLSVYRTQDALEATVSTTAQGLVLRWVDALGGEREVGVGYVGQGLMEGLAREVTKVAGWGAFAVSRHGPEMLIPGQVVDAQGDRGGVLMACVRVLGCRAEEGAVVLDRAVRSGCVLRVSYRAGYEEVPEEVRELCVRMAGERVVGLR